MTQTAGMNIVDATNLGRLMNCNGSRNMPAAFLMVDGDPTARDEGNAAHWLAQQLFNGVAVEGLLNSKAFNGVIITAEMIDHVSEYVAALDCGEMESVTTYGTDNWQVSGRCDHWRFSSDSVLIVDDFKYGWSIVEPDNNWTLVSHAVGLCQLHNLRPSRIDLRIHQPRPYHPDGKLRTWSIDYETLMGFYLQIAATMIAPNDELRTGLEWCRKCHALATCPAARQARMNIVDVSTMTFSDQLPDAALSYELDVVRTAKAMLDAQVDALEELTKHRLKSGHVIDNYALEKQYANTRWKAGISSETLTVASGVDCIKPGMITPAEFKRRGGSQQVYDLLTERPMTGAKLVRVDADKRAQRLLNKSPTG